MRQCLSNMRHRLSACLHRSKQRKKERKKENPPVAREALVLARLGRGVDFAYPKCNDGVMQGAQPSALPFFAFAQCVIPFRRPRSLNAASQHPAVNREAASLAIRRLHPLGHPVDGFLQTITSPSASTPILFLLYRYILVSIARQASCQPLLIHRRHSPSPPPVRLFALRLITQIHLASICTVTLALLSTNHTTLPRSHYLASLARARISRFGYIIINLSLLVSWKT